MSFYNVDPSPEELAEWFQNADKRNAVLPDRMEIQGRTVTMQCSIPECKHIFTRQLLPKRNDPVYVCPSCKVRIYIPVEW
ncbi:MAG: hypothetical protein O3C63_03195 [Cyanobacteria bacterium]|nr:hypothetical protein [Cyanobacteriota bacterium]MDA1020277.1 hypothetical protein [Cyanobacteriota bacterium]